MSSDATFERNMPWIWALSWLALMVPFCLLPLWGIAVYVNINELVGITICLSSLASYSLTLGFLHWKSNSWRMSRTLYLCVSTAVVLLFTFQFWTAFLKEPFTYLGISAVFVSFSMIPTARLNYWCAEVGAKQLHEYEGIAAALSQMDGNKGGGIIDSILGGVDTVLGSVRESVESRTGSLAWKRWGVLTLNWAVLAGYGATVHGFFPDWHQSGLHHCWSHCGVRSHGVSMHVCREGHNGPAGDDVQRHIEDAAGWWR